MKTASPLAKKKRGTVNRCKCCNNVLGKNSHSIYDEKGKAQNIEYLLMDSIGKQTHEQEGLHQAVCDACLKQLIQTYEFKQKCLNAESDISEEECTDDEAELDALDIREHIESENVHIQTDKIQQSTLDFDGDKYRVSTPKAGSQLSQDARYSQNNVMELIEEDNMEEEYLDYQDDIMSFIDESIKEQYPAGMQNVVRDTKTDNFEEGESSTSLPRPEQQIQTEVKLISMYQTLFIYIN